MRCYCGAFYTSAAAETHAVPFIDLSIGHIDKLLPPGDIVLHSALQQLITGTAVAAVCVVFSNM